MTVVETKSGKVRGTAEHGVHRFFGIPYGEALPPRRFLPAQPPTPWTGIRDCLAFGPLAMQSVPDLGIYAAGEVTVLEQGAGPDFRQEVRSEDSLVLNVWTPGTGDNPKRPVMFWCHGGGFWFGTGGAKWTDGSQFARNHDTVVVAINHRLNIFGHLYLDEVGGEKYRGSGNAGLLDIVLALRWVRDNIAAFGGDSGNVTIFGESGGGSKVIAMLASPVAQGLFHKAIVQSGSLTTALKKEKADATARAVLRALDIAPADLERIQAVPAAELLGAMNTTLATAGIDFGGWSMGTWHHAFAPVLDGAVLPHHPYGQDAFRISADIPLIIGTTGDEAHTTLTGGDPALFDLRREDLPALLNQLVRDEAETSRLIAAFTAARPELRPVDLYVAIASDITIRYEAIRKAELKASLAAAPVYMYLFTWEVPTFGGKYKSAHGAELPFVFSTLADAPGLVGTEPDPRCHALAEKVNGAWAAFARSGVPTHPGLPRWLPYSSERRSTMLLDYDCQVLDDPRRNERLAAAAYPHFAM